MISTISLPSQAVYTRTNKVKLDAVATIGKVANTTTQPSSISAQAANLADTQAPSVAPDWDYYLSYNNVEHSQEDFKRVTTEGGRLLSRSQGLPEGHYDFSRMNGKQLNVAINDKIANDRAPQSVIDGLNAMLTTTYDTPRNLLDEAAGSIKYESSQKNTFVVEILKAALTYMQADKALFETLKPKELTTQEALSNRSLAAQPGN